MENGQHAVFSVSGWLPNGMKVYFSIPMPDGVSAFDQALMFTNALLEKGFMQREPGLNEGEQKETIGYVSRRNKKNSDGTISTVLDLYVDNDKMEYRFIAVYLDNDDDTRAFEAACGIKLASIPLNPTDAAPGRDNAALVIRLPKTVTIIYKDNPKYDANSTDKKPKRYFERWDGIGSISNEKVSNSSVPEETLIDINEWNETTVKALVAHYAGKLTTEQLLEILKVKRFGEWTQGKLTAYKVIDGALSLATMEF